MSSKLYISCSACAYIYYHIILITIYWVLLAHITFSRFAKKGINLAKIIFGRSF